MASEIDLQQFCSTEEFRPYLHKPFTIGAHTYATNGHIAVRVPAVEGAGPPEKFVSVEKLFDNSACIADHEIDFPALPDVPRPKKVECGECDGTGKLHDCPHCTCKCDGCDGTGEEEVTQHKYVRIDGELFDLKYIKQISELRELKVACRERAAENPLYFTFNGGDGVLMGVRGCEDSELCATIKSTITTLPSTGK